MKTFDNLLKNAISELSGAGVPEAELNAWYLLAWAVALNDEDKLTGNRNINRIDEDESDFALRMLESAPDRVWFNLHREEEVPLGVKTIYSSLVEYRKKRVPLEYITHITEFMGLPIYVDPSVLIPRQDTEVVVEEALKYAKGADVLDLCTGSGCIAVSLAKLGKVKSVTATDKSVEAFEVAKKNAGLNAVDVRFLQGDMWGALEDTERFDLIVSNPPYIRRDVIPTLMNEVQDYEPVMALDGGEDGLVFYKSIMSRIGTFLREGGHLVFEIGYDQGEAVASLMKEAGLVDIEVKKDYAGCDRVVTGKMA